MCGLSDLLSVCVLMSGLAHALFFDLNVYRFSIMVGSMCLWVVFKDLIMVLSLFLCIVVTGCFSVIFVGVGMSLLLSPWYASFWVFKVSLVFMLEVLLVLLKPLLIPHTRVCGLS